MQSVVHEVTVVDGALAALRRRGSDVVLRHESGALRADEAIRTVYRIARVLRSRGLGKGDGFALLSGNLPQAFLVQLAGMLLGARYTPLHPLGSLSDHLFILDDAEIDLVVFDPRMYAERAHALGESGRVRNLLSLGPADSGDDLLALTGVEDDSPLDVVPSSSDIAGIFYTGGTTGVPKGVVHTHAEVWYTNMLAASQLDWPTENTLLVCTPISHAGGWLITPALIRNGSAVLVDRFDPHEFLNLVEAFRITATFLVPTQIYGLLDALDTSRADISSLEVIFYGAAPMSVERLREGIDRLGPVFAGGYGQTEAGISLLSLPRRDLDPAVPGRLATCGKPVAGVVMRVVRESGAEADVGEVGELCLRGPMVMSGYWKRDEATAYALRDGWLHTDDMGFVDEHGFLTLVDRRKDMIISGGFNVYPSEVEAALAELAEVKECAVIGVPDDHWGEAVHAFVVLRDTAELSEAEVIDHVRERKGPVNTPKRVHFRTALPLTPIGKLDKKALRAARQEGA
ncbi:AMP-binding protein [Acrocarpospora pleiomorpha]